jgi:hypothetical protein
MQLRRMCYDRPWKIIVNLWRLEEEVGRSVHCAYMMCGLSKCDEGTRSKLCGYARTGSVVRRANEKWNEEECYWHFELSATRGLWFVHCVGWVNLYVRTSQRVVDGASEAKIWFAHTLLPCEGARKTVQVDGALWSSRPPSNCVSTTIVHGPSLVCSPSLLINMLPTTGGWEGKFWITRVDGSGFLNLLSPPKICNLGRF